MMSKFYESARLNDSEEKLLMLKKAKRDYENAESRFNSAEDSKMNDLTIFDMNAALKRASVIIKSEKC